MKTLGNWMITEEGLGDYLGKRKRVENIGIKGVEDFFNQRKPMEMVGGVAHIHVTGTLLNNPPTVEKVLGNTSYQDIQADFDLAESSGATSIRMEIDSPGGMAEGAPETAQRIGASPLPVTACTNGYMCSAAYFLAAGADEIVATESATVGSIGTVLRWSDASGFMESIGVTSGSYTNEGADLKDIDFANPTPEQKAFIQENIDDNAQTFQGFVSAARPDIDEEVFRAGFYGGSKALALGLIDRVGTA